MNNYLGQSPVFGDFPFQILSGDGTPSYTLTYKVSNENGMLVFLNGAIQRPGIDYTAGGTSLVFSESIPIGVQIFTYGMGLPKSTLAPSAGSVGPAELAAGVKATGVDAQDWANALQLLTPSGLKEALQGANQSLAANGYQKLPGGLILQWGTCSFGNAGTGLANVTFPITFPIAVVMIAGLPDATNNISVVESMNYTLLTTSSVQFVCGMNTSLYNGTGRWIALGY